MFGPKSKQFTFFGSYVEKPKVCDHPTDGLQIPKPLGLQKSYQK